MAEMTYQVAVIGGGPAGYVAAIRAAQLAVRWCCLKRTSWAAPA